MSNPYRISNTTKCTIGKPFVPPRQNTPRRLIIPTMLIPDNMISPNNNESSKLLLESKLRNNTDVEHILQPSRKKLITSIPIKEFQTNISPDETEKMKNYSSIQKKQQSQNPIYDIDIIQAFMDTKHPMDANELTIWINSRRNIKQADAIEELKYNTNLTSCVEGYVTIDDVQFHIQTMIKRNILNSLELFLNEPITTSKLSAQYSDDNLISENQHAQSKGPFNNTLYFPCNQEYVSLFIQLYQVEEESRELLPRLEACTKRNKNRSKCYKTVSGNDMICSDIYEEDYIVALHTFNELRDAASSILGAIAEIKGIAVQEVCNDFNITFTNLD